VALERRHGSLFLAVLLSVDLRGLFTMVSGVGCVPPRRVGMVSTLLMMSAVVMLGGFLMMVGSMCVVFRSFFVVFGSFLRHGVVLHSVTGISEDSRPYHEPSVTVCAQD